MTVRSTARAYEACRQLIAGEGLERMLEPPEHVLTVEELRLRHRPKQVRLLVIAESHVRTCEQKFGLRGPAYLYNHLYYTPWWRHLLIPAYELEPKTSPESRKRDLLRLQEFGFWVLDLSLVAVSGYRKLNSEWPNRPFESVRKALMEVCWEEYVRGAVEECQQQRTPPKLVLIHSIAALFPKLQQENTTVIKLPERANQRIYASDDYRFGTTRFRSAVEESLRKTDASQLR